MNLDTKEGMAAAVAWTNNCMGMLKDGGVWVVPRSGTQVLVLSYQKRRCLVTCTVPDPTRASSGCCAQQDGRSMTRRPRALFYCLRGHPDPSTRGHCGSVAPQSRTEFFS